MQGFSDKPPRILSRTRHHPQGENSKRCLPRASSAYKSSCRRVVGPFVRHWRDGRMAVRQVAPTYLDAEKRFRRMISYRDTRMFKALLEEGKLEAERGVA